MLGRAQQRGGVIVVVAPMAPMYVHKFVTPEVVRSLKTPSPRRSALPQAQFMRLDQLPALNSDGPIVILFT